MASHTIDKFTYNGNTYNLQDNISGYVTTDEKLKTSSFSSSGNSTYLLGGPASITADTKYYIPGLKFSLGTSLNTLEVGTGNNSEGQIKFGNNGTTGTQTILKTSATAGKTITLPADTGTLALTSDIPTDRTKVQIVRW